MELGKWWYETSTDERKIEGIQQEIKNVTEIKAEC